jgi:hypothetical protein
VIRFLNDSRSMTDESPNRYQKQLEGQSGCLIETEHEKEREHCGSSMF